MGSVDNVDNTASSSVPEKKPSRTLIIKNFPASVTKEEIDALLAKFGTVKKSKQVSVNLTVKVEKDIEEKSGETEEKRMETYLNVTYDTPDMAQYAMEQLNDYELHGSHLAVEYSTSTRGMGGGRLNKTPRGGNGGAALRVGDKPPRRPTLPLRILVPGEFVGAIIGRKGETIRNITTTCKARVDVLDKDNSGLLEKAISIFGPPENCSNACKEILKVIQHEINNAVHANGNNSNRSTLVLRMLAEDRYCGRIIGREGKLIKKLKEETETRITVSNNSPEVDYLLPDRVITIRGQSIDNIVKAEAAISSKLVECLEKDSAQQLPYPGMGGQMMMGMMPPMIHQGYPSQQQQQQQRNNRNNYPNNQVSGPYYGNGVGGTEVCQITVPNSAVGAIIGSGGAIIKQIMQESNARVSVETARTDEEQSNERIVVIKGTTDACWKASYFIFEKMKQQQQQTGDQTIELGASGESVKLKTAIKIPRSTVGRVIGKAGKNVREIQRMTGAMIKLPEDQSSQGDEVLVEVYGTFIATQGAHNRIRALVSQTLAGPAPGEARPAIRGPAGMGPGPRRAPQPIEAH